VVKGRIGHRTAAPPQVNIGSYPNTGDAGPQQAYRVRLQLNGRDEAAVEAAVTAIRAAIQPVHE
jgi:hypothetical protein